MDPFEDKMNKALQKLAADIIPSDELLTKAKICADKVSHTLFFHFSAIYVIFIYAIKLIK